LAGGMTRSARQWLFLQHQAAACFDGVDAAPPRGIVAFIKWNINSVLKVTVEFMIY
jgi:hypothetical protein